MRLVTRYISYVWPFWFVQYVLLLTGIGIATGAGSIVLWWIFTLAFNGIALLLAWDIERTRLKNMQKLKALEDELRKRNLH